MAPSSWLASSDTELFPWECRGEGRHYWYVTPELALLEWETGAFTDPAGREHIFRLLLRGPSLPTQGLREPRALGCTGWDQSFCHGGWMCREESQLRRHAHRSPRGSLDCLPRLLPLLNGPWTQTNFLIKNPLCLFSGARHHRSCYPSVMVST